MAGELEKGLYVKVPAPTRDAYLVAGMAILLRVSRNAVHNGASSRRIPCCQGGWRGGRGVLRVRGRAFRVEQAARDLSLDAEAMGLVGGGGFLVSAVRR